MLLLIDSASPSRAHLADVSRVMALASALALAACGTSSQSTGPVNGGSALPACSWPAYLDPTDAYQKTKGACVAFRRAPLLYFERVRRDVRQQHGDMLYRRHRRASRRREAPRCADECGAG